MTISLSPTGSLLPASPLRVSWFRTNGQETTEEDWNDPSRACLGVRLAGGAIPELDWCGNPIKGDTLLLNGHHKSHGFKLPAHRPGVEWELLLNKHYDTCLGAHRGCISGDKE